MQEWMKGWLKSGDDKGTGYVRNRGTLAIVLVAILVAWPKDYFTLASFVGRLILFVIVLAAYCAMGKLMESHNHKYDESTSFAARRTRP